MRERRITVLRLAIATLAIAAVTVQVGTKAASAASVQSLTATVTSSGAITVAWDQPSGANPDHYSYTVYYRASGSWSSSGTGVGVESKIISGLTGGTSYEFRVTATPAAGTGCAAANVGVEGKDCTGAGSTAIGSAPTVTATAATVPGAPTITSVTASNTQVAVAFSAGATNGATVTQYTATCGASSVTGSSSPLTVSGLTNGVAYTCRVVTGSNVGDSSQSSASSEVTPSTTPDTMDPPTVSAGDASVLVTWTAVSATGTSGIGGAVDGTVDDAGSPVTGYEVRIVTSADSVAVGAPVSVGASSTSVTLNSTNVTATISNGTAYKVQIRASNANGSGTYSSLSDSVTPASGGGGGATSLSMSTQPGNLVSRSAFSTSTPPVVNVGAAGVVVTASVASGGATLGGVTTATSNDAGLATFSALTVRRDNEGLVSLRFQATGYTATVSAAFTVTLPSLAVATQPGGVATGVAFSGGARPVITVGYSDVVVTAAVASGGATLSGTTTATAGAGGTATFTGLVVNLTAGGNVTLQFTATGFTSVTSAAFAVTGSSSGTTTTTTTTTTTVARSVTTTTVARSVTTTTVARSVTTTVAPSVTTTTVPAIVVAPKLGTEVPNLAPPAPKFAEDATVAVKAKTLTVLIDPPDLPKARAVAKYVVTVIPVGGGKPITRTITVTSNDEVIKPQFSNLGGRYRVSVTAVTRAGKEIGTWTTKTILVKSK